MGLFKKLLRPLATTIQEPPHQPSVLKKNKKNVRNKEKFSHHIDGKENFNPVKQKANNGKKRNKKGRSDKEQKRPFWKKHAPHCYGCWHLSLSLGRQSPHSESSPGVVAGDHVVARLQT